MPSGNVSADQLRLHIEAVERLESEKAGISDDIKDRYLAMKSEGFDVKVARKIVAMRKKDQNDRTTEEAVLATYIAALDMQTGFGF